MAVTTMASESKPEIELAKCECCGLKKEYTAAYIESVRRLHAGKLICGLCSEAVKYEKQRGGVLCVEEALAFHMGVCGEFRSSAAEKALDVISALMQIFRRRSLESSTTVTSEIPVNSGGGGGGGGAVCSPVLGVTDSCLPTLSGGA